MINKKTKEMKMDKYKVKVKVNNKPSFDIGPANYKKTLKEVMKDAKDCWLFKEAVANNDKIDITVYDGQGFEVCAFLNYTEEGK